MKQNHVTKSHHPRNLVVTYWGENEQNRQ